MDQEIRSANLWCKIGAAMAAVSLVVETVGWCLVRAKEAFILGLDGHAIMIAALFLFVVGIVIFAVSYAVGRILVHLQALEQKITAGNKEAP
jgi:hypothetical protein